MLLQISAVNRSSVETCVPCILSICPIFRAAPRTLHRVLTILSALASESRGESIREFVSTTEKPGVRSNVQHDVFSMYGRMCLICCSLRMITPVLSQKQILKYLNPLYRRKHSGESKTHCSRPDHLSLSLNQHTHTHTPGDRSESDVCTSSLLSSQRLLSHFCDGPEPQTHSQPCRSHTRRHGHTVQRLLFILQKGFP